MPAPKVRSDYQSLGQISRSFTRQAEVTRKMLSNVKGKMGVLQKGDWVGKAATKFYNEMDSQVLPSVQRLISSLERASTATNKISQIMKQAEEDAARVFRLEASGSTGVAEGSPALTSPISASAAGNAAFVAAPASGTSMGETPNYSAYKSAADGAGGGVVGRMLKNSSPEVRELAAKSPTLLKNLQMAERLGVKILPGSEGAGSYREGKTIVIARGHTTLDQVSILAHETAHLARGKHVFFDPTNDPVTKDEWVNMHTRIDLDGEGNSVMHQGIVRDEIINARGPDIGIFSDETGQYLAIYQEWKSGQEVWDGAQHRIGELYADEQPSNYPPGTKYRDYFAKDYIDYWDKNVAPARQRKQ